MECLQVYGGKNIISLLKLYKKKSLNAILKMILLELKAKYLWKTI